MIASFRGKEAEALFNDLPVARLRAVERQARRKLLYLDAATAQWRICFRWQDATWKSSTITEQPS
jgi:plasmid maintenance system killer protein